MNVTLIGSGFVGVVSAAVFADIGNQVWCLSRTQKKIDLLNQGKIPFYEPELEPLVKKTLKTGRLKFTTDYQQAISSADVIFIAVGTPSLPSGQADLSAVLEATRSMAPYIKPGVIVIVKSTVPPGTNDKVAKELKSVTKTNFYMASVPEFLKEGTAVSDTIHPDRIVIGATEKQVINTLKELHRPLGGKIIVVKPESAQMSKYAANAYLAQRITFINQIANLCEQNGADVQEVITAMGPDKRIGTHYWYPGLGYGGSCFPKDVRELSAYAKSVGESTSLFIKINDLNEKRIDSQMDKFGAKINGWKGKHVAVLGLSFKPNTDDIREAPSLKVIPYLKSHHATISGYDPVAGDLVHSQLPYFKLESDIYSACKQADAVITLIEWPQINQIDLVKLKSIMKGNCLIDTRNQFDPDQVNQAGLEYIGVGR